MRIFKFTILPAFVLGTINVTAQDVVEAYNISNQTVQGTARSMGFGNALGSVGGDFSCLSVNPAGLGIYRSSELSFTPSLRINSAVGNYAAATTSDNNTRVGINSFALVFTDAPKGARYEHRKWKAVSFAFGMNRVADFNRNYTYSGYNSSSSASQVFEADANLYGGANSTDPNNYPGYMGYQSYLLNVNSLGQYYSVVPFATGINQVKTVQERGSINEYVISLGGNYKEKLMLGVTLGIPSMRYKRTSTYTETVAQGNTNNPDNFTSFSYNQVLDISGVGVNAKLGIIYKFADFFRMGAAFHTPSYYSITDVYDPSVASVVQGQPTFLNTSYNGGLVRNQFDYRFSTPWRGVLSATIMIKKMGFITADVEFVDYSSSRFYYSDGFDYTTGQSYQEQANAMNREIKQTYQGATNFRLGAEGRISKYFMLRGGFGYYGNPYTAYGKLATPNFYSGDRIDLNFGLGFRFENFFTDLGFVHSRYQGTEQPYSIDYSGVVSGAPAAVPTATINNKLNNLAWTIGVKF